MANEKRGKHFGNPSAAGAAEAGVGSDVRAAVSESGEAGTGAHFATGATEAHIATGGDGAQGGVDQLDRLDELGDRELTRLFSSFDGIRASSELKASTLSAIFDGTDASEETSAPGAPPEIRLVSEGQKAQVVERTRVVHAPIAASAAATAQGTTATPDAATDARGVAPAAVAAAGMATVSGVGVEPSAIDATAPQQPLGDGASDVLEATAPRRPVRQAERVDVESGRTAASARRIVPDTARTAQTQRRASAPESSARKRRRGLHLRVAAAFLAVTLILGGGIAYTMPVSNVEVALGESKVTLGVNVFGVTVSAQADGNDAKETLKKIEVHNMRLEDSMERLLSAYEEDHGPNSVQVTMQDRNSGESMALNGETQRVLEQYEQRWQQDQPTQGSEETQPQEQAQQSESSQRQSDSGQTGQQSGGGQPQEQQPSEQVQPQDRPAQEPEPSQGQQHEDPQPSEQAPQGQQGDEPSQPSQAQEASQPQEPQADN